MADTTHFEHSHDIVISASPAEILDYVSNPQTWCEWMPATHAIDSENRALRQGEEFFEKWHTRQGEVSLDWRVTEHIDGSSWVAQTHTDFTGPVIARYTVEEIPDGTRYTRTIINPERPKAPTDAMITRMNDEAVVCLDNIKSAVERRTAASGA